MEVTFRYSFLNLVSFKLLNNVSVLLRTETSIVQYSDAQSGTTDVCETKQKQKINRGVAGPNIL